MKYVESETVELKSVINDDIKIEIISFLNSYLGGTIYIGVDDLGNIIDIDQKQKDINESKIINWIRDEAILPNCSDFVKLTYNEDGVLAVNITPGDQKPYYLKEKGLQPKGVYIRYGRNKSMACAFELARMWMESNEILYEDQISRNQDLSFNILKLKFEEKKLDFKMFKMVTSGFIKDGKYTNLAYIFSDQYDIDIKFAIYIGNDRAVFKSKKQFNGSILNQLDKALDYFETCNETRIVIDGSAMRKEYPSYNDKAAREAVLNTFCHRDYMRDSNIKVEFFDDRCEIISPGGFHKGLTLEKALEGSQSFRNKNLVQLLYQLGYIENYASGLNRIFSEYKNCSLKPVIKTDLIYFKVILPNENYTRIFPNDIKEVCEKNNLKEFEKKLIKFFCDKPTPTINETFEILYNIDKKE